MNVTILDEQNHECNNYNSYFMSNPQTPFVVRSTHLVVLVIASLIADVTYIAE
jgi:hypothetical protein